MGRVEGFYIARGPGPKVTSNAAGQVQLEWDGTRSQ